MVATTVLAKVDGRRLERAAEGLMSGAYEVVLSHQGKDEVRGTVRKKIGKAYGGGFAWLPYHVALTDTLSSCSCPDAVYRGVPCKHCVVLALYSINHPEEPKERKLDLTLRKVRSERERKSWKEIAEELYGAAI
jgi:hypothetical protein